MHMDARAYANEMLQGSGWHSPIEPMAQENKNWLKKNQIGSRKIKLAQNYEKYDFPNTLRLHYNADSAWLPNISQYNVCENVSR